MFLCNFCPLKIILNVCVVIPPEYSLKKSRICWLSWLILQLQHWWKLMPPSFTDVIWFLYLMALFQTCLFFVQVRLISMDLLLWSQNQTWMWKTCTKSLQNILQAFLCFSRFNKLFIGLSLGFIQALSNFLSASRRAAQQVSLIQFSLSCFFCFVF